jgi:ABC-type bacteriocin/lantibiotic exporter with double-glycine peptidase domain
METLKILKEKWKNGSISEIIVEWKWILSYSKKYKKAIAFYIVLGVFSTIFGLVSAVASQKLIDIVTGQLRDQILVMALVMVIMALFSLLFSSYISRISLKISIDIQNDIQADIFEKIEDASWQGLSSYHSGDVLNRFITDVNTVASNAITWLPSLVVNTFNFIATFCVIMYYDVTMALISLASAPVLLLSSQYLMGKMREYSKRVRALNSDMMSFEQETFYNMDTIKSFGITARCLKELKKWQKKYKEYNLDYNKFSIKTNIALSLVGMLTQYAAFGWGVYRLWSGYITYGEMTLFLTQGTKLSGAFNSTLSFLPNALNSSVAAGRIMELVNLPREVHYPEASQSLEETAKEGLSIHMHQVYFQYEEKKQVLKQMDFEANPNEIIALVGASGEGKTTILRLILGLIFPEQGEAILIDHKGNKVSPNADTRRYFSYVPQGNTLFSGTVAENFRMVKEDVTEDEIEEALTIACAWDFVSQLPEGINGILGERGHGVSEGQAQRIAIARAIVRDAPILILDEATSALDVDTEKQVLHNIIQQRPNKTCIVATHRPTVLHMCQRIYRIKNMTVEQLTKDELLNMENYYKRNGND